MTMVLLKKLYGLHTLIEYTIFRVTYGWENVPSITQDAASHDGLITQCISVQEAIDYFKALNLPKVMLSNK